MCLDFVPNGRRVVVAAAGEKVRHGPQSGAGEEEAEAGRAARRQGEAAPREGGQGCGGRDRPRGVRPGEGHAPRFGRDAELAGRGARVRGAVVAVVGELGGLGQLGDGHAGRQSADDQSEWAGVSVGEGEKEGGGLRVWEVFVFFR